MGDKNCINVLRTIGKKSLTYYTDEEDFILGTMLGYDGIQQCQRYIQRKKAKENLNELAG